MTEDEKKAAAEQKQREMEEMMRQAQESYRQEYASMPYDGPVYGCRREELMLPMQDGVRRDLQTGGASTVPCADPAQLLSQSAAAI